MIFNRQSCFFFKSKFDLLSGCVRTPKHLIAANEDDDVAAERQRIYSDRDNSSGDVLRIVDLVKVFV